MFLSIMAAAYKEEKLENGETRVVLQLPAAHGTCKTCSIAIGEKRRIT